MVGAPQAGKRILLIDDDFTTREVMSVLLAGDGYRVSVAANGAEALERLRAHERPELILLDMKMPVMDGCSFCEHRRRDPELAAIPIVVLSALPDAAEQAAPYGVALCLQKPVDAVDLLVALRQCCAGKGAPAPVGAPS
jgi:CheY-like chemotaxis protein